MFSVFRTSTYWLTRISLFSTAMRTAFWAVFQKRRTPARVPNQVVCTAFCLQWATLPPASPAPQTTAPARHLQHGLHAEPGLLQTRGRRVHRPLHRLRDWPARPGDEIPVAENRQAAGGARHLHQQRHAPQQLVRPPPGAEDAPHLKSNKYESSLSTWSWVSLYRSVCEKQHPGARVGHHINPFGGSHSSELVYACEWKQLPHLGTD